MTPKPAGIVDDAAALDAAVDVLDAHAAARDAPIRPLVLINYGAWPLVEI
jgi:hypothetical protein